MPHSCEVNRPTHLKGQHRVAHIIFFHKPSAVTWENDIDGTGHDEDIGSNLVIFKELLFIKNNDDPVVIGSL